MDVIQDAYSAIQFSIHYPNISRGQLKEELPPDVIKFTSSYIFGILHDKMTYMNDIKTPLISCIVRQEDFID